METLYQPKVISWPIVGHCPKCGAPIYPSGYWIENKPPDNIFTCNCTRNNIQTNSLNTEGQLLLEDSNC